MTGSCRECRGMYCKGVMQMTCGLDGVVKWVCAKCGREENSYGSQL